MLRRWIVCAVLFVLPLWAHADWAADRDASAGYVTVTVLASAVDEAVPFFVVYGSDLPPEFHAAMTAASDTDGKTIRASTADGSTQLACVPIGVDTGTDTFALPVLGTGMSTSVDVDYRIYVGNASLSMPTASGGMGEQAVFADYLAAWSMTGASALNDLTASNFDLTVDGSPTSGAAGPFEGLQSYTFTSSGAAQNLYYNGRIFTAWPAAIETLFNWTSVSGSSYGYVAATGYQGSSGNILGLFAAEFTTPDKLAAQSQGGTGSVPEVYVSATAASSTWHYGLTCRTGATGTLKAWLNGADEASSSATISAYDTTGSDRFRIASAPHNSTSARMGGSVGFTLVSGVTRSANYASTMQDNWAGALYSAGAWTALGSCNSGSTGWVLLQTAAQSTSAAADWANINDALVDDANTADVTLDDTGVYESEYLNLTNPAYGTTPPAGADSYTVHFRIKKKSDTTSAREIQDLTVQFVDDTGTRVGDNLADAVTDWPSALGTTDYTMTGYTPDGTEFTSAAGVSIRATGINTNGSTLAEIATVWIKVDWDCGDDPTSNARGFFALTE